MKSLINLTRLILILFAFNASTLSLAANSVAKSTKSHKQHSVSADSHQQVATQDCTCDCDECGAGQCDDCSCSDCHCTGCNHCSCDCDQCLNGQCDDCGCSDDQCSQDCHHG